MENVHDRIRENDIVIAIDDQRIYSSRIRGREGTVKSVYYMGDEGVAVVEYSGFGLAKILTNDLIKIEVETVPTRSVSLSKARYNELTSKVMERVKSEVSDTHYDVLKVSAELLFNRLEALLFGEADNG